VTEARRPATHGTLQLLIIGYGNGLRRDDGAGLVLAERLAQHWQAQGLAVQCQLVQQLTPELAGEIAVSRADVLLFVDATVTCQGGCIQLRRLAEAKPSPALGHHLDPALLMSYAQLFADRLPHAWVISIGGDDFTLGEGFSPAVDRLLAQTAQLADNLLKHLQLDCDSPPRHKWRG
jgi:hydrogenase maturation protease